MDAREKILCPSARCKPGAALLGVVREDGTIAFLPAGFEVDEDFVRIARQGRNPESRFRFADRCVEGACQQWQDHHCTIPERHAPGPRAARLRGPRPVPLVPAGRARGLRYLSAGDHGRLPDRRGRGFDR